MGIPLELEDPDDRLRALVRLRGREEGACWLWYEGVLHGRAEGDVVRPVCGFTSVLCIRYERLDSQLGHRFVQRESNHYFDLASGEPIGDTTNPYTGKVVVAVGYVSPAWSHRFSLDGTFPEASPGIYDAAPNGRMTRGLESDGIDLWATETRVNEMGAGIDETMFPDAYAGPVRRSADVGSYRGDLAQVLDTDVSFVPASITIMADTPWTFWLLMGRTPGHMIWTGQGSKTETLEGIPGGVRRRVELVHPGFLADPWGIDGAPYASSMQLRRLREEGRI